MDWWSGNCFNFNNLEKYELLPLHAKSNLEEIPMANKNLDIDSFYECVRNFRNLGTGRNGKKILIGDSDDARVSHFSFATTIRHNRPSRNEVTFANGEVLDIPSQTIRGKRAYVFPWNELTEDLWFQQIARTKILRWFETAQPQDWFAMAELIFEPQSAWRIRQHPDFPILDVRPIQIEIRKLNLPQLRKLTGVIDGRGPVEAQINRPTPGQAPPI